ncbi:hypothetical protein VTL71DRAFT_4022 [Oculimacula yallundae]|uniref:Secreted protein n=1 Tax=Oculimacula yallundae TaxID=86028 RepID=A0ABR4C4L8_9HELO
MLIITFHSRVLILPACPLLAETKTSHKEPNQMRGASIVKIHRRKNPIEKKVKCQAEWGNKRFGDRRGRYKVRLWPQLLNMQHPQPRLPVSVVPNINA